MSLSYLILYLRKYLLFHRPGAFWAESFPILKLIPDCLAGWKREVKRRGAEGTELLTGLALAVKTQMEKADAPPSFTKTLWERHNARPDLISQREIAYATGSLFGAGSDTTASTLMSFILAMTCFPHVAAKAQEEIDRVIPNDRSPTWSDMPMLPYCNAVIKETLRWRPVAVMGGTPHATTQDDHYQGHFIPKGTTIMGNLWAIHHNEKYFKESHHFIPERYLDGAQDGTEAYPGRDGHSAFGWVSRFNLGKCLDQSSANKIKNRDVGLARENSWQKTHCLSPLPESYGASTSTRRLTSLAVRSHPIFLPIPTDSTQNHNLSDVKSNLGINESRELSTMRARWAKSFWHVMFMRRRHEKTHLGLKWYGCIYDLWVLLVLL